MNDIVRLKGEAVISVFCKILLQRETEGLGNFHVGILSFGIMKPARYIDFHSRGSVSESTGLKNQILDGHTCRIFISSWEDNLTIDRQSAEILVFCQRGDEKNILVLKRNISGRAIHDTLQIDRYNFLRTIGLHAPYHSSRDHGFFCQTISILNQGTNTADFIT